MKEKLLRVLKSSALFALVLNAFFLAGCFFMTSFTYEGTADYYNSIYICRDHMYVNPTINYVLAIIIGTVQMAFPAINCFVLFEVLASYAAFASVTFVFADKYNKVKALVFTILLNIMFALHHYANVDSTRTSALLCASGFLLVLLAIHKKRYSLSCWVGVLEVLFGSFLNITYFFVALGFAFAFFFGDMIAKKKYRLPFRKFFWYFRPFLLMFLLVSVVTLGMQQFSYAVNHSNEQAAQYYEYAQTRSAINTLPYPSYSEHKEELAEAGIDDENKFELLKNGYYDKDTGLTADALKAVRKAQLQDYPKNFINVSISVFKDNYSEIMHLNRSIIVIAVYLMVSLVFIFYHKNRFSFFPLFYFIVGYMSSFTLRMIYNPTDNITYGVWLLMIVMLLNSFNFDLEREGQLNRQMRKHHLYFIVSCAVVVALATVSGLLYFKTRTVPPKKNSARFLISELNRNPDCYYVMDPVTKQRFIKHTENYLHPMWGFRDDYLDNLDDFGYFHREDVMHRRNYPDNIYQTVLTKKKVFVIDNGIVFKKERYFTQYYSEDGAMVFYDPISEPSGYKIYKVCAE